MADNTSDSDKVLREALKTLEQANNTLERAINIVERVAGRGESVFKQYLKAFNSSTLMMILNAATAIGGCIILILGSEIISEKVKISKKTLKYIKEAVIFGILGILLISWIATGCYQLWKRDEKQTQESEPPPDEQILCTSIERETQTNANPTLTPTNYSQYRACLSSSCA